MIEYISSPENFGSAFTQVLNGFVHVKLRDKNGKAVVMMHEDEFNAIVGQEPTDKQREILKSRYQEEGSIKFNNADEIYQYFGLSKGE